MTSKKTANKKSKKAPKSKPIDEDHDMEDALDLADSKDTKETKAEETPVSVKKETMDLTGDDDVRLTHSGLGSNQRCISKL